MRVKKGNIFVLISIIFLGALTLIYGYRFFHYYLLEHNNKKTVEEKKVLYDKLISYETFDITKEGLLRIDNKYIFMGKVTNNYLYYNGIIWRIVSVDFNKNIKLIADNSVSSMVWGVNSNYQSSYIRKWLNSTNEEYTGIFNEILDSKSLINMDNCIDQFDDIDNITCEDYYNDNIMLLSVHDYLLAGGKESYLNIEKKWWLINTDSTNKAWHVTTDGGLSNIVNIDNNYYSYGIRPVITINGDINLKAGNGSLESPFIIEEVNVEELVEVSVGTYIEFEDYKWRVIAKEEDKIKVVMNDYIKDKGEYIELPYSTASNIFSTEDKDNIGYYLNNDFIDSFEDSDYLKEGYWYIGNYNYENVFDYKNIFKEKIEAKVGLVHIGELFTNDIYDTFMITGTDEINETIYKLTINDELLADITTKSNKIRPALYLDSSLKIIEGTGNIDDPYIISR
ncbi:MAG: DUF6273 domain-containing protein [Bacilli bacterium]